jgi:1-acyl-sn-glycerol-3-phosphate acyltransferase
MVIPGKHGSRQRYARALIGFFFRTLVSTLEKTGCMTLYASQLDHLETHTGMLILANHPTYIDVVVLLSLVPQANCVVKGALWKNPFYWSVVRAAGYIRNDAPESTIQNCAQSLLQGESIVIFPEGTRTRMGEPMHFLRGTAHIALLANPAIVPVLIQCDPPTQTKGEPFWQVPPHPFDFRVKVLAPLPTTTFQKENRGTAISARQFTSALQNFFSQELTRHGFA